MKFSLASLIVGMLLPMFCACHKYATPDATKKVNSFEELSEKGRVFCRNGQYIEGMTLLIAAKDSLDAMHPDSIDPKGAVRLLGNLSNLYTRMGLYEEAKQTSQDAMKIAESKAPELLPDLWRMRGQIYSYALQTDSDIYCLRRSVDVCRLIENEKLRSYLESYNRRHIMFVYIEHPDFAPDSVEMAMKTVERIGFDNPTDRLLIGRAKVLLGDYAHGIPIMEKAIDEFRRKGDTESLEWGLQYLAKSYTAASDRKLIDIYDETTARHDSIMQGRSNNHLLGMDFKYRASRLKQDKAMLENELNAKRQRIIFISVISLLIVAALVAFIIIHHRYNRRRLQLRQQNIDTLLTERIALNARIEELNRNLSEAHKEGAEHEVLKTILLEKEDEQRFRKTFNDLYPGFIDRLRREYPELTAGNELLCMLIALNRRNDEIALALGISRESVTTSRYRLRNRFNLPKDVDLNDFIKSKL